ncbi:LysR family transcriptional regulator [Emcibacteraceae bacterium]|nr:LysR family transcriptional regulator [Emcibacteraceae bacterium]
MNLKQIKAFHATIEEGSVSRAAAKLNLSQPAVTKLLKNLQSTVEYQLFNRVGGSLEPTKEARYLFQEVDTILVSMSRVDTLFKTAQKLSRNRVKIGSIVGPSLHFIPYILGQLIKHYPELDVTLITRGSPAISDNIMCHALDVGLIDQSGISPNYDVEAVPVSYFCALHNTDPLTQKEYLTPHDLSGKPLISLPPGQPPYERFDKVFRDAGAVYNIAHEIYVHMPALSMVREGLGIAFVDTINMWSYEKLLGQSDIVFKPFKPLIQDNLTIITPNNIPTPEHIKTLVNCMKEEIINIEKMYQIDNYPTEEKHGN